VIEMTVPGKPTSSKQKYRLTAKGRDLIAKPAMESAIKPEKMPGLAGRAA